jgi:predicted extracellular nuclease
MKRVFILTSVFLVLAASLLAVTAQASPVRDTTAYAIQRGDITAGDSVRITNVVITGVGKASTKGFWAQELPGGFYSGILCYTNAAVPFSRGDLMRVKGVYAEYGGTSEINTYASNYWEKLGTATLPTPVLLSCKDIGYSALTDTAGEKWEGVLVQLDNVRCVKIDPTYNQSYLVVENHNHPPSTNADTVYVRNNKMDNSAPVAPPVGDTLLTITGVIHQESNQYRLCPRDGDDIINSKSPVPNLLLAYATSNTTIEALFDARLEKSSAENTGNYTLYSETGVTGASLDPVGEQIVTLTTNTQTPGDVEQLIVSNLRSKAGTLMPEYQTASFRDGICPISLVQTIKAPGNDSSQYAGEEVTTAGIVTGDRDAFTSYFYIEQTGGGPWSGVQIYGPIPTTVAEGDSVIVAGFCSEYYNKTEVTSVDYLRVVNSGNPIPGPDSVDIGQIKTGSATAENYEGVFVYVNPAFVSDTIGFRGFGEWRIFDPRDNLDTVVVSHSGNYNYIPRPGRWMNIRGPMDYAYNNFRMEPRRDADIDTLWICCIGVGAEPKPAVFALEQNAPNPFNPVTTILFSIPAKANVELYVYDISGRVVKRLVDGVTMEPGRHKATWDGRNDAGRAVSSGVYFCKLLAADKVAQMKMVILK